MTSARRGGNVTSIVSPVINGGPGGIYNFGITESDPSQDGEALVVVYSNPSIATSTVAILDGYSAPGGDSFTATFANPLHPAAPGFAAEMALGDGFSCCGQSSTVVVDGTTITNEAGNNDDSIDGSAANGNLITVGGFNDGFSPLLPTYAADHERYNLIPYITDGSSSIVVQTNNPTNDDNIFLAVLDVTGQANVVNNSVPEPSAFVLFGTVLAGAAYWRRRRHTA